MRLLRGPNHRIGLTHARRPHRMAKRQRLTRAAALPAPKVLEEARCELRLTACSLHQVDELVERTDWIVLCQIGFQVQPPRTRIAETTGQSLALQRHDPALQHPVEHHGLGESTVEAEHDAPSVMGDAYPFCEVTGRVMAGPSSSSNWWASRGSP